MTQQSQPSLHQAQSPITTPVVLTIAGSDSGGGAGIQADIKAMSATGSFACSVITAITSQNTQGVSAIFPIPLDHVESQLDAVFTDLNIVAVKVGMLADSNIIKVVADKIKQYQPKHLVIDPVMVATSGDLLLEQSAIRTLQVMVPEARGLRTQCPENRNLRTCIGDMIVATNDMGNAHIDIVHDTWQGIEPSPIFADQDGIGHRGQVNGLVASN